MCGLFGFVNYKKQEIKGLNTLAKALAVASSVRGTHATGIAYNMDGELIIHKEPKSAHNFKIDIPENTNVLMGHTRFTTQGTEKKNYNNHPFKGETKRGDVFALAHNGIIYNDIELSRKFNLPFTEIETDSYVAVQLLELWGEDKKINMEAMKFMGEQVEGMFTFTILDKNNNLYIVKNDSPFSIFHFKDIGLYVYASTRAIIMDAIMNSFLENLLMQEFTIKKGKKKAHMQSIELLEPKKGDIWKIDSNGMISYFKFRPKEYYYEYLYQRNTASNTYGRSYYYDGYYDYYGYDYDYASSKKDDPDDNLYMDMLYSFAERLGFTKEEVDLVHDWGYSYLEIEDALYDNTFDVLLNEVKLNEEDDEITKEESTSNSSNSNPVIVIEGKEPVQVKIRT